MQRLIIISSSCSFIGVETGGGTCPPNNLGGGQYRENLPIKELGMITDVLSAAMFGGCTRPTSRLKSAVMHGPISFSGPTLACVNSTVCFVKSIQNICSCWLQTD